MKTHGLMPHSRQADMHLCIVCRMHCVPYALQTAVWSKSAEASEVSGARVLKHSYPNCFLCENLHYGLEK